MMQNQQQTLQVMMAKMEADERRRKEQEALNAAVANPFGSVPSAASGSLHLRLQALTPRQWEKGRVRELEEYHRWCKVLTSWLVLIDDNYVNELHQAMVHDREIKQSKMTVPVASRSARLFYYLQQSLQKFERGMELVRSPSCLWVRGDASDACYV